MAVAPLVSFALACLAGASCGDFPECAVFFTVLALAMARPTFFWWIGIVAMVVVVAWLSLIHI